MEERPGLARYLVNFKRGDYVDIVADPSVQKGCDPKVLGFFGGNVRITKLDLVWLRMSMYVYTYIYIYICLYYLYDIYIYMYVLYISRCDYVFLLCINIYTCNIANSIS